MHTDRISYLLDRYLDGDLSPEELQELCRALHIEEHEKGIHAALAAAIDRTPAIEAYREADFDPMYERMITKRDAREGRLRRMMRKMAVAAAVLLLAGGAVWWGIGRKAAQRELAGMQKPAIPVTQDIPPGGNKAVLTLSDNSTVVLDDAKEGLVGREGNAQVVKKKDGQLAYQPTGHHEGGAGAAGVSYNLLTTPRGGQYQLILPDGSKVWLNAASSLRYPTAFNGRERVVELKGEAYFEIAPHAGIPFRVTVPSPGGGEPMAVNVLGTHFNIKAYSDEPTIGTTLLEGSVKVQQGATAVLVKPGQKASYKGAGVITVAETDTEEAVAWKNGIFKFDEATIEDVMRQLSRWYDVDVVYVNGAPKDLFRGEIYRNVNVSKVLKVLEASGVQFTMEGKKLLVK